MERDIYLFLLYQGLQYAPQNCLWLCQWVCQDPFHDRRISAELQECASKRQTDPTRQVLLYVLVSSAYSRKKGNSPLWECRAGSPLNDFVCTDVLGLEKKRKSLHELAFEKVHCTSSTNEPSVIIHEPSWSKGSWPSFLRLSRNPLMISSGICFIRAPKSVSVECTFNCDRSFEKTQCDNEVHELSYIH